jgi:hypothetical protein
MFPGECGCPRRPRSTAERAPAVIVVDSAAIVDSLNCEDGTGDLRERLAKEELHAPALLDFEVVSARRGLALAGHLSCRLLWRAGANRWGTCRLTPRRDERSRPWARWREINAKLDGYDALRSSETAVHRTGRGAYAARPGSALIRQRRICRSGRDERGTARHRPLSVTGPGGPYVRRTPLDCGWSATWILGFRWRR